MIWATSITDASFCPNTKASAWAAWVKVDGILAPIKRHGYFKVPVAHSEQAELYAALIGIWFAKEHNALGVLVQTDCISVVDAINGVARKGSTLETYHREMAEKGLTHLTLKARHVKGHTAMPDARSWINRWCDQAAGQLMREQRAARKAY